MEQAISLPEIRCLIGKHLSFSDLKTCMLVSRAWEASMAPWLWRSVNVGPKWSPYLLRALRKHKSCIRSLHLYQNEIPNEVYGLFNNLQSLQTTNIRYSAEARDQMEALVLRNRSSLRTMIEGYSIGAWESPIKTMMECPSLDYLGLAKVRFMDEGMLETFHQACTRIKRLRLLLVENWYQLKNPEQIFINLRIVRLVPVMNRMQLKFLARCPNLRQLSVFVHDSMTMDDFFEIVIPACTKLEALHYDGYSSEEKEGWRTLIQSLPLMKSIQLGPLAYRYRCLGAPSSLARHFSTLQAIWLDDFSPCRSMDIQSILCSCPNLRFVSAKMFHIKESQDGSPWVCHQLQYFGVYIMPDLQDPAPRYCVYNQLAQLSQLRVLDIGIPRLRQNPEPEESVFCLGKGLELLAPLKKLWHIDIENQQLRWRTEEVEWVIQTWPNLRTFFGRVNRDIPENVRLWDLFKASGISPRKQSFKHLDYIEIDMS